MLMAGILVSAGAWAQDNALALKGREIAIRHCARCHVVDRKNRFSGISSTPSFPLIVEALDDWEERFGSFHTRLPHPSVVRFRGEPVDESKGQPTVPSR
jgi:hypothetical protein